MRNAGGQARQTPPLRGFHILETRGIHSGLAQICFMRNRYREEITNSGAARYVSLSRLIPIKLHRSLLRFHRSEVGMDDAFMGAVMGLIQQHGGVQGLVQTFEQGGMGGVAQSWVAQGQPNQPVDPADVHNALGADATQQAAAQAGMDHGSFLNQLAAQLPGLIDHMTPNGQVPAQQHGLLDLARGFFQR
jgi:uncharacterized protein YidB (DUF937 family)